MEIPMIQTRHNLLEPGAYHVKVGEWTIMESIFGCHVVMRLDLVEEGLTHRSVTVCVDAELTGGEEPSQLYSWISALVFAGEALPEAYTLETASLLLREAWAGIEVVDDEGVLYNRIARLSPLRGPGRGNTVAASQGRGGLVSSSPNPLTACPLGIPAESHGIFDGYCT